MDRHKFLVLYDYVSAMQFSLLFRRLHVGVDLPVTVPAVQCTLTDMARSYVAADPPTICF